MNENYLQLDGTDGDVSKYRFGIAVSSYHRNITSKLLEGALSTLQKNKVDLAGVVVAWAPGAWELPLVAQSLIQHQTVDAVVTLGCVIRGQTTHDRHINTSVSQAIQQLSLSTETPIGFGLLTCNTTEQAMERAGGSVGNKGQEATDAVLEMLRLTRQIRDDNS